jgi:hypothetical protein
MMKSDPNCKTSISAQSRAKRMQIFVQRALECNITAATVLDIGGTVEYWKMNSEYLPQGLITEIDVVNKMNSDDVPEGLITEIDAINLPYQEARYELINNMTLRVYGGNALDKATLRLARYDIVHSNSVIEHVGNLKSQWQMGKVMAEIADYHWVQTPAKSFPLEPHFYFPFFSYLPLPVKTFLYQRLKLGFMGKEPNWLKARMVCEETRLLTKQELAHIFPLSEIINEYLYFWIKAYVATNMAAQRG